MRGRALLHRWGAWVLLLLGAAGPCVAAAAAGSLLMNGSLEEGSDGTVPGWSLSFYPSREGIGRCLSRSRERARHGRWSLRIDTTPVLGEEVTLVYNAALAPEATRLRGRRLALSGWVYVEPGTAVRPMGMRLRMFGRDSEGRSVFLGDVLDGTVLGSPGKWLPFRFTGVVPDLEVTQMDLHCGLRPDMVPTVQFLDGLRIEPVQPAPLSLRLPRNAIWRDEALLAAEVELSGAQARGAAIMFTLEGPGRKVVARWRRPVAAGLVGLALPGKRLPEGSYLLRAALAPAVSGSRVAAAAAATLEVAASPWEDAPPARRSLPLSQSRGPRPPAFAAMGTTARTEAPDGLPSERERVGSAPIPGEWRRRGFVVFARHYLDGVSRLGRPGPGETLVPGDPDSIRLFASPGEYEPAAISVWAIRRQTGVHVTTSDLAGEQGRIPAVSVDVRAVRTLRGLPAFHERRARLDIPEGQTQTFLVTVHVPGQARPGYYRGSLHIAGDGVEPARVGVLLRVLPLKLPPPPRGYGFWWKMDGRWKGYYSDTREEALRQIRKQLVLLREYGCNMISCYGMPRLSRRDDGTILFDFTQDHWGHDRFSIADLFDLARETRFFVPRVPIQYPGADSLHSEWVARSLGLDAGSPAFEDFYRRACRRVSLWARQQGHTLAFACVDEIGNSEERRQEALRFYRLATEAGVLTSVTDNSMHAGMHLMGQPRFDSIIAMRVYNFITPEMIGHARRSGDRLWLYNMGSGGWDARRDRFVFGLFTERCGAEGYCQWAFQWPAGNTDPYEEAAAGRGSGYHYALPSPDGPLPTLALEGVREGIDDARYLALLRRRAPGSGAASLRDLEPLSIRIGDYVERHTGTYFDVRRWRMARAAMAASSEEERP